MREDLGKTDTRAEEARSAAFTAQKKERPHYQMKTRRSNALATTRKKRRGPSGGERTLKKKKKSISD